MISNIKMKIELINADNSSITNFTMPTITNNASGLSDTLLTAGTGQKLPFLTEEWGEAIYLMPDNGYDGVVFDQTSDANGNCSVEFTVNGQNLSHIAFYFDKVAKEYPTELIINGTTYTNNLYSVVFGNLTANNAITIKFIKWNKPNRPIRLIGCSVGFSIDINKFNSLAFTKSGNEETSQANYGIAVNSGNVSLVDYDGQLYHCYKTKILVDGLKINVLINDNTEAVFYSKNVDYVQENKEATFDLVTKLQDLQKELYVGYELPQTQTQVVTKTALTILNEILGVGNYTADSDTQEILNSVTYTYPIVGTTTKYSVLNKLLKSCMCACYENKNGEKVVKYVG